MDGFTTENILDWIVNHPHWTGLLVFFVAFLESLAFVGVIVPGAALMIAFGAAISSGYMSFWPTMWWAVAGAIVGDFLSYWFGRHFGGRLAGIWPLSRRPELLQHGIRFFEKHGGKSVALGRFVGPLRAVVPAVAGMMAMPVSRFVVANVSSALVWAPVYLLPGIILGVSLEMASEVAGRLTVLLIVLVLVVYVLVHLVRYVYRRTLPYVDRIMIRLMGWSERHPFVGKLPAAVVDPMHAEARGLSLLALMIVITSISFSLLARNLLQDTTHGPISRLISSVMTDLQSPAGDVVMTYLAHMTTLPTVAGFVLGLCLWFASQHLWKPVLHLLAAFFLPLLTMLLLVFLLGGTPVADESGISGSLRIVALPVSQISVASSVYVFTAVLLARELHPRYRPAVYSGVTILLGSTVVALLYLGRDWPQYVLGGLLFGLIWAGLLGIAYRRHIGEASKQPRHLLFGLGLLFAIPLLVPITKIDTVETASDTQNLRSLSFATWQKTGWQELPAYRDDFQHRQDHPLTIQWAGSPDTIRRRLLAWGWQPAPPPSADKFLQWFNPTPALQALPVLPQVHAGRFDELRFLKLAADKRWWIIRLWQTDIVVQEQAGQAPLWIGNASSLEMKRQLGLTVLRTGADFVEPLRVLTQDINDSNRAALRHDKPAPTAVRVENEILLLTSGD